MAGPRPGALRDRPFNPFATMLRPPEPFIAPRRAQPVAAPQAPAPRNAVPLRQAPRFPQNVPLGQPPLPLQPGGGPIPPGGAPIQEPQRQFTDPAIEPREFRQVPDTVTRQMIEQVKDRFEERFGKEMRDLPTETIVQGLLASVATRNSPQLVNEYAERLRQFVLENGEAGELPANLRGGLANNMVLQLLGQSGSIQSESLPGEL